MDRAQAVGTSTCWPLPSPALPLKVPITFANLLLTLANARIFWNDPQAEIIVGSASGGWWAGLVLPNRSANPQERMFKALYYTGNRASVAEAVAELVSWIQSKTTDYGSKVDWSLAKLDGTEAPLPRLTTRDIRGPWGEKERRWLNCRRRSCRRPRCRRREGCKGSELEGYSWKCHGFFNLNWVL